MFLHRNIGMLYVWRVLLFNFTAYIMPLSRNILIIYKDTDNLTHTNIKEKTILKTIQWSSIKLFGYLQNLANK